jgi:hypothetical protein
MLRPSTPDQFVDLEYLGVAVRLNELRLVHVGLLYKQNGRIYLCHLAANYALINTYPDEHYLWQRARLPILDQQAMASYIRLVVSSNGKNIPYRFGYDGIYFDRLGKYIRNDEGNGLTCATFIMALYKVMLFDLLEKVSWMPRPDDDEEMRQIVAAMRTYAGGENVVAPPSGHIRFRPEEVAFGVLHAPVPVAFDVAGPAGELIRQAVRAHAP